MASNQNEPITTTNNEQQDYQSITLRSNDTERFSYLAVFPPKALILTSAVNESLLLANVSNNQLGQEELNQRQRASPTTTDPLTSIVLSQNNQDEHRFSLSSDDINELSTRLQVVESIINYNGKRLRSICERFIEMHRSFHAEILGEKTDRIENANLNSKQMSILLEFFLQIDVDVFFMKTCQFRDAEPYPTMQGLFCNDESIQARYRMTPCGTDDCSYCSSMNNPDENLPWSTIDFENSSQHRFLNGYTTYLNCPATCTTSKIVYVLTCPCGEYEFIGSTSHTIIHALEHHRLLYNHTMHSILTGSSRYYAMMTNCEKHVHDIRKSLRQYQHLAHCPVALQLFVDHNPKYSCFLPMSEEEAEQENSRYKKSVRATGSEIVLILPMRTRVQRQVQEFLKRVPLPPTRYKFSEVQLHEQRLFFENFLERSVAQSPFKDVDLFEMKIIAVLPDDKSSCLRNLIETLFIIHCEPKLNMLCADGIRTKERYGLPYNHQWQLQFKGSISRSEEYILSIIETITDLNYTPIDNPEEDD